MKKHYTPEEIKRQIKREAEEHKGEAIEKAADMLVPQMYAALALAIMEDQEDPRTEEEKGEYIKRIFDSSQQIWTWAAGTGRSRAYRLILRKLKDRYGIQIQGIEHGH
ncbi:MAG: hypothetical protein VZR08_02180 [Anaerovoracaceae bacterium]|nr:hypothetical protein [Anaerovoracaceae bacterium]